MGSFLLPRKMDGVRVVCAGEEPCKLDGFALEFLASLTLN